MRVGVHAGRHLFEELLVLEDLINSFDLVDNGLVLTDIQLFSFLAQELTQFL